MAAYARGLQRDFSGDPAGALEQYQAAIEANPAGAPAYLRALAAHGELRRKDKESGLLLFFEDVADRHPDLAEPARWIARLHAADDRTEEAMRAYEKALRRNPADRRLHAERLALVIRTQRTPAITAAFRDAFLQAIDPAIVAPPAVQWLLGAHQEEAPDSVIHEALRVLEHVQQRAADQPNVLLLIGQAYRQANRKDRAMQAFEQARSVAPDLPDVYLRMGLLHLAGDDFSAARAVFREGIPEVEQPLDLWRLLAESATQHALRLQAAGDNEAAADAREEAIGAVRRLVDSLPAENRLRLRLADLLILSGRTEDAVRELGRIPHPDADLQQEITRRLLAAGAPEEALALLRALAAEAPGDAGIHAMLGEVLAHTGETREAIEVLERAGRMEDPAPAIFLRRALWLTEKEKLEAALDALREGLAAVGEDPVLLEFGALLLLETEDPEEALSWLARLDAVEPEEKVPTRNLHRALALQYVDEPDEAARRLADEIAEDRQALERFIYYASRLDERFGTQEATRATLYRLAEKAPADPFVSFAAGLHAHHTGRHARAAAYFENAWEKAREHPDSEDLLTADFFFLFGAASERSGTEERAMDLLAESIRLDPDHALALNYLAYMWAERAMNLDRALHYVERALAHEPDSAAFMDTLGWIYFQQGRYEEALAELERALGKMPDDPTIADHVGDALHKLGRTEEAVAHWLHAYGNDPENPDEIRAKLSEHGIETSEPDTAETDDTEADDSDSSEDSALTRDESAEETDTPLQPEEY